MTFIVKILLCSLVAFRLAEMLVFDDGPFDIILNIRGWFNRAPMDSRGLRRTIANGLQCPYCTGIWMSFLVVLLVFNSLSVLDYLLYALAVAGIQSILSCKLGRSAS